MPQLKPIPINLIDPDPDQPRKLFDDADLLTLSESLKIRQIDPIQVKPVGARFTLIDGERRWRAGKLAGLTKLDAIVTELALTPTELSVFRLTSFFHKKDLTGFEKWKATDGLMVLNPGWTQKELALSLSVEASTVGIYLSPSKCTPAWQEALRAGKVGISDCAAAARSPLDAQDGLLNLKFNGASRETIAQHGRKSGSAKKPSAKAASVKCLLPSGYTVIVKGGSGVSLEDASEALADAIKEMKRAKDLGYSAKTFGAAMKDKAAKG